MCINESYSSVVFFYFRHKEDGFELVRQESELKVYIKLSKKGALSVSWKGEKEDDRVIDLITQLEKALSQNHQNL